MAGAHVGGLVTHHERGRQVDPEPASRAQQHAGQRFAAGAAGVRRMGAVFDGGQFNAGRPQQLAQPVMLLLDDLRPDQTAADPRLVGHHHQNKSRLRQGGQGGVDAGQQLHAGHIVQISRVPDQGAVTIKEHRRPEGSGGLLSYVRHSETIRPAAHKSKRWRGCWHQHGERVSQIQFAGRNRQGWRQVGNRSLLLPAQVTFVSHPNPSVSPSSPANAMASAVGVALTASKTRNQTTKPDAVLRPMEVLWE